jgi:RimJ/RimL family protein N-acetyltransferase
LVAEVERRMRARGVLKVNAIVFDTNSASLSLFRKLGYVPDKRSIIHGKIFANGSDRDLSPTGESF